MYRRCMKSSEKVRFVRNTFQGALFLHLYLTDLLQMRGRRMSCTSKCEFRSKYAEIFLNCGVRKQEMAFSKAQTQAIMHKDGPMMVLAGPGSGKTTVITHRVQYLTKEYGIDPGDILVITFTRAAAEEMRERYEALTGGGSRVTFGTFHSIFFRILKLAYRYTADNIVREEQQMQFVRELAQAGGLEPEDENEFAASILSEISSVKGERIALEHYYSKNCPDAVFRQLYAGYEEKMRRAGLIDFDDMMVLCLELFTERKDILSAWQRRYRYILIDEFQDINRLQYEIVRMLAKPEDNLFIVGDDDQSIYRFRGAKPEIMLGFERDYPGAGRILLDVNYRSTEEIVAPALRLIGENQKRFSKAIHTTGRHGKNVITKLWQDPGEENLAIAREIQLYLQSGVRPGDIAVLYRTNAGPRFLMEKLMEYNLPFRTRDTVPNLYEHWISRNILTYIRIAMGSRAREDILQVINRPKRYISRDAMPDETVSFEKMKAFYAEKDWIAERIESLEGDLRAIARMSPLAAVNYIRQGMGYDEYLIEYAAFRRMRPEELLETADELKESAAGFKTFDEWFAHIEAYKEELLRQAAQRRTETDAITLATMHSAKGLEFPIVYILDANEGITPHSRAMLDEDMEEERRLFYVAMTRAKTRLHVYAVRERYHKKAEVSRFVWEYLGRDGDSR
jgi:DNA helicase-2/ATP-dependent DNA helicase PcrA